MSLVHNEQTKLTATFLNGIAIAVLAVGGLAPLVASLSGGVGLTSLIVVLGGVCFVVSLVLHLAARHLLRGLRP